jgi:hypothetical protein
MIVALAYNVAEQEQAARLAAWMRALAKGINYPHTLVIATEKRATNRFFADMLPFFEEVFEFDYVDHMEHYPESKNLAFQQCALYIASRFLDRHWLYIEPDVVPTRATWLDEIAAKATARGKPFLGCRVPASPTHRTPVHMAAIGVYPVNMIAAGAGDAMTAHEHPWPAVIAKVALASMTETGLICHDIDGAGVPPGCALYHPDRDGKILESLSGAQWKGREVAQPTPAAVDEPVVEASPDFGLNLSAEDEDHAGSNPAPSSPWKDRLESEERVKALVAELKTYCTKPAYSRYVRNVIKTAKLTPAGSRSAKQRKQLTPEQLESLRARAKHMRQFRKHKDKVT